MFLLEYVGLFGDSSTTESLVVYHEVVVRGQFGVLNSDFVTKVGGSHFYIDRTMFSLIRPEVSNSVVITRVFVSGLEDITEVKQVR